MRAWGDDPRQNKLDVFRRPVQRSEPGSSQAEEPRTSALDLGVMQNRQGEVTPGSGAGPTESLPQLQFLFGGPGQS